MINSNLRCKDNTFSETIKYFCHFFYFSRRFFRCFSLKTQESCCIIHATRNLFRYPPSVLPPRHNPSSQHGEPVEAFQTALLNAHGSTEHDPAGGLIRGDTQGLIGSDAREPANILDIRPGVVLIRRRPAIDNRPDGIEPVIMVVCTRQHLKRCTPAIRHCFKLTELWVCLQGLHALPLIIKDNEFTSS